MSMYTFMVYEDRVGEFRWSLKASNGEIVADSGEGYYSKYACLAAVNRIKENAYAAGIQDLT